MKKNNSQLINTFLIVFGGALLIFQLSTEEKNVYILITGFVALMWGLYRATNHWTITKDDHKLENEEEPEEEKF
ncbi:hypothetical protein [Salinimicrobium soli]|uniref:hypothetical protein n=1 Tax=Salinimicrobium soli TaxID=1254399 RepID=UPI003AB0EBB4